MRMLPFALASLLAVIGGPAPDVRAAPPQPTGALHERDFDWEIGTWATDVCVLRNPLSGQAPRWAQYRGTSVVRALLAGRWNFVELSVVGSSGTIEGGSLRLFNPQSRQWSLNFASLKGGVLTAPVYGAFDSGGRGMFTGADVLEGRAIMVRFIITRPSANQARFEQAYSADGGVTWENNWIAVDNRRNSGSALPFSKLDPLRQGLPDQQGSGSAARSSLCPSGTDQNR